MDHVVPERTRYVVGVLLLLMVVLLWTGSNFVTQVKLGRNSSMNGEQTLSFRLLVRTYLTRVSINRLCLLIPQYLLPFLFLKQPPQSHIPEHSIFHRVSGAFHLAILSATIGFSNFEVVIASPYRRCSPDM